MKRWVEIRRMRRVEWLFDPGDQRADGLHRKTVRVCQMLELARGLLEGNAEHVAACPA